MEKEELKNIIFAILVASTDICKLETLVECFTDDAIPEDELKQALAEMLADTDKPLALKQVAGGYRYQINEKYNPWIARVIDTKACKPSKASIEVLGLIVYYQPVSRSDIDRFRGCVTNASLLQQLLDRKWIKEVSWPGKREKLFVTTLQFLKDFSLNSIFDMPDFEEMQDKMEQLYALA